MVTLPRISCGLFIAGTMGCSLLTSLDRLSVEVADRPATSAEARADVEDTGAVGSGTTENSGCFGAALQPLSLDIGALAPRFASSSYAAFDLGPVPVDDGPDAGPVEPIAGCAVARDDPNTLLFVGRSDLASAAIYSVMVRRDACGHIVGLEGPSKLRAPLAQADANLIYAPDGTLLVPLFPSARIAQIGIDFGPVRTDDLKALGVKGPAVPSATGTAAGESPGGIAFVPPHLGAAGELRAVTYPSGNWYHLATTAAIPGISIVAATKTLALDNGPGAIAYVPSESPAFAKPSILVTEWFSGPGSSYTPEKNAHPVSGDQHVVVYEVDDQGDPIPSTRAPFFAWFERPWGASFDPVSGDLLLIRLNDPDHLVAVHGFAPPPK